MATITIRETFLTPDLTTATVRVLNMAGTQVVASTAMVKTGAGSYRYTASVNLPDGFSQGYFEFSDGTEDGTYNSDPFTLAQESSDPLANEVPGDYEEGTAGWALGRIADVQPPEAPVNLLPGLEQAPGTVAVRFLSWSFGMDARATIELILADAAPPFVAGRFEVNRNLKKNPVQGEAILYPWPTSTLLDNGFATGTYRALVGGCKVLTAGGSETFTIPDEGGNLWTLLGY